VVFGGRGFLGRYACAALEPVAEVLTPGRDRVDLARDGVGRIAAVLRDTRPDAVVTCVGQLAGSATDLLRAQTLATAELVEAIGRVAPGTRLVRLGSAAEYGPVRPGYPVREDDPAEPVSPYGLSHLAATQLVRIASAAGTVDGVVLRVFNPIGPGLPEDNLLGRAVRLLRDAVRDGAGHITFGSLSAYRDFVDVTDVAAAVVAAVRLPAGPRYRVFNVGRGRAVPARRAVALLAESAGYGGEIRETGTGPARSAGVGWIQADGTRAAEVLGWRPVRDLAGSLKAIWAAG
jgi:nucleoside-diphosphate-sugar epimerase